VGAEADLEEVAAGTLGVADGVAVAGTDVEEAFWFRKDPTRALCVKTVASGVDGPAVVAEDDWTVSTGALVAKSVGLEIDGPEV
jgi:hypothetical protein